MMIPQISQAPGVVQLVLNFLQVLEQQGFTGDTATSYADRLTMATDNSVYQLLPGCGHFSSIHGGRGVAGARRRRTAF
ncbi:Fe-S protein, homolog of lactate dehydrogenase SO1521 [Klebsiella pneumoniae IS10]|nr:Fe-S protein, homolog of lactate dehydrogenase SO1521 [Klebsiella pneumoniae IS10]